MHLHWHIITVSISSELHIGVKLICAHTHCGDVSESVCFNNEIYRVTVVTHRKYHQAKSYMYIVSVVILSIGPTQFGMLFIQTMPDGHHLRCIVST